MARHDSARRPRRARGFSLIEVVVTVAIIALLASIAAPLTETVVRRGKERDLKNALMTIRNAIDAYFEAACSPTGAVLSGAAAAGAATAVGTRKCIEKKADETGYPKSLDLLVSGVPVQGSLTGEKIYFLRRLPRDPLADPALPAEQTWGLRSYDSPPDAPQAGKDVFDVYSNAPGSGLNGIPYREW